MRIKEDMRIQRTKMMIKTAFIKLLKDERNIDSITIQEISNQAFINRSTFYLHYLDKYDLLEKIFDEYILSFKEAIAPCEHVINKTVEISHLKKSIQTIFETIEKESDFYTVLLKNCCGCYPFAKKMEIAIKEKFKIELEALDIDMESLSVPKEMLLHYIAVSLLGLISWWLNDDMKLTPKQMSLELFLLFTVGPVEIVQVNLHNPQPPVQEN